ncbi:hypothetical protein CVT25_014196 [Psilocybe cyanescens]|uniref:Uncharacterized protein n=1 Tax=Psilocybe cyanescens TaxID=93625 RepID=A0A409XG71_PSICY|nr:hypothetical protein CVT25_014196 [Psilocybe cyanescens]
MRSSAAQLLQHVCLELVNLVAGTEKMYVVFTTNGRLPLLIWTRYLMRFHILADLQPSKPTVPRYPPRNAMSRGRAQPPRERTAPYLGGQL